MKDIKICNLRDKNDLAFLAESYANYYSNSVLGEKWTTETAEELFMYFYDQNSDLFFVAYDNNKPVATIMSTLKPWWDGMHLEDGEIFVCNEYRQRGWLRPYLKHYLNMQYKNMVW